MPNYDIIILGSGIVGATAALALAKTTTLKIAVLDSQSPSSSWEAKKYDHRVSAISLASRRIFQNLNVWQAMCAKRVSAYTAMQVWEEASAAQINFDCASVREDALGYIVEDSVMRNTLHAALQAAVNIDFISPVKVNKLQESSTAVTLVTEDQQHLSAKLFIAADGANSWGREQVGIQLELMDYEHTALVTTVKTAQPHSATARQHFLSTGPLAFLPLSDSHTSSIVWSTLPNHAKELLLQDDAKFRESLTIAFAYRLGTVLEVEARHSFPLTMRHVKNYVKPRVALIGDAAHTLHPLAGQGVNLGLLDAVCLAEVIQDALTKNRDFASFSTLRRYERWRKGGNSLMLAGVEFFKKLFLNEKKVIASARQMGLSFVNATPLVKNFLADYALGNKADLPELASEQVSLVLQNN